MSNQSWCTRSALRSVETPFGKFFSALTLVITLVGLVANTLTILVMRRPALRTQSTMVYFLSLAIFDNLKLLTFLPMWAEDSLLDQKLDGKTYFTSDSSCAAFMFLQKTATCTAIWLVTTVTLERVFIVFFPLEAKTRCTRSTAKKVVLLVFFINILFCCDYTFTTRYDEKRRDCSSRTALPQYTFYRSKVKGVTECIWKLLPLLISVVANFLIVWRVRFYTPKRMRGGRQSSMKRHNDSSKENSNLLLKMLLTVSIASTLILLPPNLYSGINKFQQFNRKTDRLETPMNGTSQRLTTDLISLPVPTKLLNSTSVVTHHYVGSKPPDNTACAWVLFKVLVAGRPFFLLNHAANFFLYILSGRAFRHEFIQMMKSMFPCLPSVDSKEKRASDMSGTRKTFLRVTSGPVGTDLPRPVEL